MLWSGTRQITHELSDFNTRFTALEDTFAGFVYNQIYHKIASHYSVLLCTARFSSLPFLPASVHLKSTKVDCRTNKWSSVAANFLAAKGDPSQLKTPKVRSIK